MYAFLIVIHVFVSLVLIAVILMQAGRGGGVSEMFGGMSTQTIFGTSATKFLTRATGACAILFIVTSLSLAVLSSGRSRSLMRPGGVKYDGPGGREGIPAAVPVDGREEKNPAAAEAVNAPANKTEDVSQKSAMPAENEKEPVKPTSQ